MHIKLKRAPGIYLAGFMGSGKSTVGRMLAERLGWQFADLDAEIEAGERQTIGHIFEARGETEFRRIETAMIGAYVRHVERGAPTVIALGGGAFVQPGNYDLIENHGVTIWLDCSFESIEQRLAADPRDRPLARDPVAFRKLYDDRQAGYSRADFRVEGNCHPAVAVEAILALPLWK
jgi:shikimate kinase